jgi:hypothetical protein
MCASDTANWRLNAAHADGGTITDMLQAAERQGSNWVLGQMVDRVSPSGELTPVLVRC